jgi:hypothetical protein
MVASGPLISTQAKDAVKTLQYLLGLRAKCSRCGRAAEPWQRDEVDVAGMQTGRAAVSGPAGSLPHAAGSVPARAAPPIFRPAS